MYFSFNRKYRSNLLIYVSAIPNSHRKLHNKYRTHIPRKRRLLKKNGNDIVRYMPSGSVTLKVFLGVIATSPHSSEPVMFFMLYRLTV